MAEEKKKKMTIIVFSGDMDRAYAVLNLATGAAAFDMEVDLFFTFWGLNLITKEQRVSSGGTFFEKMFSVLNPGGISRLGPSKFKMWGMGTWAMKKMMKTRKIPTLHELMEMAKESGVRFLGCQMSMEVLGLKREDLLDCVSDVCGVSTALASASESQTTLFI